MNSLNGADDGPAIDLSALQDKASGLVEAALHSGADACDVVVAGARSQNIQVRLGKVEDTLSAEADRFSLRVFRDGRVATVSSNQTEDAKTLAKRAVAMAKVARQEPYAALGDTNRLAANVPELDLADPVTPSVETLRDKALACEAAARDVNGVTNSMGAGASHARTSFVLATSAGFCKGYSLTRNGLFTSVVAGEGDGMERDYDFDQRNHAGDLRSPAEIGQTAGERTVARLGARQVASMVTTIVLDPRMSCGLLGAFAGAINGSAVARKTSFLRDKMGKRIFRAGTKVVDDPLMRRGPGSRPFDGEGLAVEPILFVEDGILNEFVLDGATARELGLVGNARAQRGGAGTMPATTNFYLEAGAMTPKELIRDVGTGFYVTEMMGHGSNLVTGDYSRGASGFWIENGEISFPVTEVTIAGNLASMFAQLTAANDLQFTYSTDAPTVAIEGMTVAGK